jgi:DNA-binding LytR/AlgR family response regulator
MAGREMMAQSRVLVACLVVLILVLIGPFDTHRSLGVLMLILYWSVIVFGSLFCASLAQISLEPIIYGWPVWLQAAAEALGMTAVFTPLCYAWTTLVVAPADGVLMAFHWFVLDVALISFAIFAASRITLATISQALAEAKVHQAAPEAVEQGTLPESAQQGGQCLLYRRIAKDDPGPILRIEAMDHFVNVVTPQAVYPLRLRFVDAVEQMEGVEGVITHRSHWVARDAIAAVQRENGRLFLRMTNCALVPVSRKYRPALEKMGLLPVFNAASEQPQPAALSAQQSPPAS